jgi:hypothetical protein
MLGFGRLEVSTVFAVDAESSGFRGVDDSRCLRSFGALSVVSLRGRRLRGSKCRQWRLERPTVA